MNTIYSFYDFNKIQQLALDKRFLITHGKRYLQIKKAYKQKLISH